MVEMDPHLGSVLLSCRWSGKLPAEIREQKAMAEALPGGGFRLRPAPEAVAGRALCPWPRSRAASSKARLSAGARCAARAAAQRSFSALLNDGSVPFQVGKVPLPRPFPDPRQPGTCRTRVAFPDSAGNVKKESDAVIPRAL